MMQDKKRIIDSVHGNIYVEREYVTNIIDTPEFQRLRRIEQTSTRAIFPSARHDRFIHSIGVYHMGSLIAEQLLNKARDNKFWGITNREFEAIKGSYLVACLLHDVGHAPFSHTFEEYYGEKQDLAKKLYRYIRKNNYQFKHDLDLHIDNPKQHELASALLTLTIPSYKKFIRSKHYDKELIVRMIIGCKYEDDSTVINQIRNCFISLLNGEVIDADRLDYACRDVWASGYSTSSIDMKRLISGLLIRKNNDKYSVCFNSNVLNEIESVLDIKDFQVQHILNHHTVVYEQYLLEEAVKAMAVSLLNNKRDIKLLSQETLDDNGKERVYKNALSKLISIKSISCDGIEIQKNKLRLLADDELLFLMKQKNNPFFNEWMGRKYNRFALWKTRDEFFALFPNLDKDISFNDSIKEEIKTSLKEIGVDVLVILRKFSPRLTLNDLKICIGNANDNVYTYNQLHRRQINDADIYFPYVYIPKEKQNHDELVELKKKIVALLKENVIPKYISNDDDKTPNQLITASLEILDQLQSLSNVEKDAINRAKTKLKSAIVKLSE